MAGRTRPLGGAERQHWMANGKSGTVWWLFQAALHGRPIIRRYRPSGLSCAMWSLCVRAAVSGRCLRWDGCSVPVTAAGSDWRWRASSGPRRLREAVSSATASLTGGDSYRLTGRQRPEAARLWLLRHCRSPRLTLYPLFGLLHSRTEDFNQGSHRGQTLHVQEDTGGEYLVWMCSTGTILTLEQSRSLN